VTVRLSRLAVEHWEMLDGYAAGHGGAELEEMSLRRLTSYVYWMFTRNASESDLGKWKARLWQPPPRTAVTDKRSPWNPENERNALLSLKTGLGLK
jgi:hypothetical protein